jgi:predicted lipopolysaccharide heptosyltransferase III
MKGLLKDSKKLLLIKLRYIGDSIWMIPVINNLKQNYPNLKISVLVNEGTEIFFHFNPFVDEVIAFPRSKIKGKRGFLNFLKFICSLRKKGFDSIIDLTDADRPALISFLSGARVRISYNNEKRWRRHLYTHCCKTKINTKHMVEYHLSLLQELGLKIFDRFVKLNLPKGIFEGLYQKVPKLFATSKKRRLLVHPGARNPLRQWGVENFTKVCKMAAAKYSILLVGGPNEKTLIEDIAKKLDFKPLLTTTRLNLLELAALCKHVDLFLGNDTAPLHIAAAMGTFVIGIYGPTIAKIAGPWTDKKIIFEGKKPPCCPCRQDKCLNPKFKACLSIIKPEIVASTLNRL